MTTEQIKAEIERLKSKYRVLMRDENPDKSREGGYKIEVLNELQLSFAAPLPYKELEKEYNALTGRTSEDLEKEIEKYWINEGGGSHAQFDRYKKAAEHFAGWQKEQMKPSDDLEKAADEFARYYDQGTCNGIAQDCFIAGAQWQKAKMEKQSSALAKYGITLADLVAYNKGVAEGRRMEKEETDKKIQDAINHANKCYAQSIENKEPNNACYWDGGRDCLTALQRDIKED